MNATTRRNSLPYQRLEAVRSSRRNQVCVPVLDEGYLSSEGEDHPRTTRSSINQPKNNASGLIMYESIPEEENDAENQLRKVIHSIMRINPTHQPSSPSSPSLSSLPPRLSLPPESSLHRFAESIKITSPYPSADTSRLSRGSLNNNASLQSAREEVRRLSEKRNNLRAQQEALEKQRHEEQLQKEKQEKELQQKQKEKEELQKQAISAVKTTPSISPIPTTSPISPPPLPTPPKQLLPEWDEEKTLLHKIRTQDLEKLKKENKSIYTACLRTSTRIINSISNYERIINMKTNEMEIFISSQSSELHPVIIFLLIDKIAVIVSDSKLSEMGAGSKVCSLARFLALIARNNPIAKRIINARLIEESSICVGNPVTYKIENTEDAELLLRKSEMASAITTLKVGILLYSNDYGEIWKWFAKVLNNEMNAMYSEALYFVLHFFGFYIHMHYKQHFSSLINLLMQNYVLQLNEKISNDSLETRAFGVPIKQLILLLENFQGTSEGKAPFTFERNEHVIASLVVQTFDDDSP